MLKYSPLKTPPSSSGPGRGPFKAKTRIRIPVGAPLYTYTISFRANSTENPALSSGVFGCYHTSASKFHATGKISPALPLGAELSGVSGISTAHCINIQTGLCQNCSKIDASGLDIYAVPCKSGSCAHLQQKIFLPCYTGRKLN
jgi:hypothetical protein